LALEHHFNQIGLTFKRSHTGNLLLCNIIGGKPSTTKLFEDYIRVGSGSLSDTQKTNIIEFVMENKAGEASVVKSQLNDGNYILYGSSFQGSKRPVEESIEAIGEMIQDGEI
jgi:hypothetical protein